MPRTTATHEVPAKRRRSISAITAPALPIVSLLFVVIIGSSLFGGRQAAPDVQTAPPERAQSYLTDLRIISFGEDGETEYRAVAESAQYFDDEHIELTAVKLDYIGGARGPWTATAPSGYVPPQRDVVELLGGVNVQGVLEDFDALTFDTQTLTVNLVDNKLETTDQVTLRSPGRVLTSGGIEAGFDGQSIRLSDQVRATVEAVQP